MACRLIGAKPISKPMLTYIELDIQQILISMLTFSVKKMHLKMSSAGRRPSCLGLNELIARVHHGAGMCKNTTRTVPVVTCILYVIQLTILDVMYYPSIEYHYENMSSLNKPNPTQYENIKCIIKYDGITCITYI